MEPRVCAFMYSTHMLAGCVDGSGTFLDTFSVFLCSDKGTQTPGAHGLGGTRQWGCPLHLCVVSQRIIPGHMAMLWFCLTEGRVWPPVTEVWGLHVCGGCAFKWFCPVLLLLLVLVHFQPGQAS